MKFEAGKEYLTRSGARARIYAVDGASPFPIHGAVETSAGWWADTWRKNGLRSDDDHPDDHPDDLMPPEPVKQSDE